MSQPLVAELGSVEEVFSLDDLGQDYEEDGRKILQDLVHYRTYAATLPSGKKEDKTQVIDRVKNMHIEKFPELKEDIELAFKEVYEGLVVPSMRTMQFAGKAMARSNARCYNCAYAALTEWKDFGDLFWLMMNGVGTGYSVQYQHIKTLPIIETGQEKTFLIFDTKEGWADAIITLLKNPKVKFIYSMLRPKGAPLSTGGVSGGPELFEEALEKIRIVLNNAIGRHLTSVECFDIMCFMADAVVAGGVRRTATIALFDKDDDGMLNAKSGEWYINNPQRARANISAILERDDAEFEMNLRHILKMCFEGGSGEPGIALTNNSKEYGFNPCLEISIKHRGLCNLTEINVSNIENVYDFYRAAGSASAIGTLQASYTNFNYLHPDWKKNAEEEALLGVSLTGQAQNWALLIPEVLSHGALIVEETNKLWSDLLGINPAARCTTTKPSGSTSAWWGTTSGIHAAHSDYYLRRVRVDRKDSFGKFLINEYGENESGTDSFIETDAMSPENIIVTMPIKMEGSITRSSESSISLMDRAKHIYNNWIKPGHKKGPNTHNVSLTVSYKTEEQEEIIEWMIKNKNSWSGISLLPYDGAHYIQAPFEEINEESFNLWRNIIPKKIDFSQINFSQMVDKRINDLSCVGPNGCEVI